jgi:Protein of unknown function (DUF3800)
MLNKTFNFYCDESCHLENDHHPYMLIGYISCSYNQVALHSKNIRLLKEEYENMNEIKWNNLSKSAYPLYNGLIDYFFATDLQYRAIVIDKSKIKHDEFEQTHDDFYYKMFFQLLHKKIDPENNYNIYLDIKDTRSAKKVNGLKKYLNSNLLSVRNLQNIRSHESELMQLTDIITGAISYHLRGLNKVIAKNKIIEKIQHHSKHPLNHSTSKDQHKFNLFFIDLK